MKYVVWQVFQGIRFYRDHNGRWGETPHPFDSEAIGETTLVYVGNYQEHLHLYLLGQNLFHEPSHRFTVY